MAPKRASTPESDTSSTKKKSKSEPSKVDPLEGLDGKKFMKHAPNYKVIISEVGEDGGELETFEMSPKIFSSGAYGWHLNSKSSLSIDDDGEERYLPVNLTLNVNVAKSKPKEDK